MCALTYAHRMRALTPHQTYPVLLHRRRPAP